MCCSAFRLLPFLIALTLFPTSVFGAGMTLAVESAKPRYLVDEPLLLTVTLTNTSDRTVELPTILNPALDFFLLYFRAPGGKPEVYQCGVHGSIIVPKHGHTFLPGETYRTRMWIAMHYRFIRPTSANPDRGRVATLSLLSKPGTYTFFARYNLSKAFPGGPVALRSRDIQVQVSQPTGAEKEAHAILTAGTHESPWAYPEPRSSMAIRRARMDRFARLVRQYPDSAYALYAQSQYAGALAGLTLTDRDATRETQTAYLMQSLEQYRIYTAMAKGTPLEALAQLEYGHACANVRKVEDAARAFETALLCPTATYDERTQALSWTTLMERGNFREQRMEADEQYPLPERTFPLVESVRAFGFTATWDAQTRTATIRNPRTAATLRVGSNTITVNGTTHTGALSILSEHGQVRVSARTLGYILGLDWLTRPA